MSDDANPHVRIFSVDTRFQQMARRPGGVPRDRAIEGAQSQTEDFKPEFIDWLDQELQQVSASFRTVMDRHATLSEIDAVDRRCCQLRDTGTTMGLTLVTFIAGNLCKILDAVKDGASYGPDVIECHIGALVLARHERYGRLRPDQVTEMTDGLQRILDRATKDSDAPAG